MADEVTGRGARGLPPCAPHIIKQSKHSVKGESLWGTLVKLLFSRCCLRRSAVLSGRYFTCNTTARLEEQNALRK